MSKQRHGFKVGELVQHERFGSGVIVDEWGSIPIVDEDGRPIRKKVNGQMVPLTIQGSGIYDVQFNGDKKAVRSVHHSRLK